MQAHLVKTRATCLRRQVGAVAVYRNEPVSQGYNGAPKGGKHCLDHGCLIEENHCVRCVHAEANALEFAGDRKVDTLYVTLEPCWRCIQRAVQKGVERIYYAEAYPCPTARTLLADYERPGMVRPLTILLWEWQAFFEEVMR